MPRVDTQLELVAADWPWTVEDVQIFMALPIHLQSYSIAHDWIDAELIVDRMRLRVMLGYTSVAHMLLVQIDAAR